MAKEETKVFKDTIAAEKYLEENGFIWSSCNSNCDHPDGRQASITDYGHKAVLEIWE